MNQETFSGIKVLVAVAQADGCIDGRERVAIENALDGTELPGGITVERLLSSSIDLNIELSRITTDDARKRTYRAACALAYADGEVSREEGVMCARIAAELGLELNESIGAFLRSIDGYVPPSVVTKIDDAVERACSVQEELANGAAFSAALASTPLPIAAEPCLLANDVRVARNIGALYGYEATDAFWRTFVANVLADSRSRFAMSLRVLISGSGNAATAAFASTFALGKVTALYFDEDEAIDPDALRSAFADAKVEGRLGARMAVSEIEAARARFEDAKASLDAKLEAGTLTEIAYANEIVTSAWGARSVHEAFVGRWRPVGR